MSGFEVAGAVLGSIPLAISALEHYRDGLRAVQRWRKYERELQSMIRNLETEKARLQNVCEKLLVGLVPPSRIEAMVDDPTCHLWLEKETQKRIRARLWRSWSVFEETTQNMQTAIKELIGKLESPNASGKKTSWTDPIYITKELKRVTFTLNRSAYNELLSTIRDGVSNLESLTTTNIELEPERRVRSRIRLFSILRDVSLSMHRAILSSFSCTCNHEVSMRLTTWSADIIPGDEEVDIVRDIKFHLALSYQQEGGPSTHLWEQLAVEPFLPSTPTPPPSPEPTAATAPKKGIHRTNSAKRKDKSVKWALFKSSTSSTTTNFIQTSTTTTTTTTTSATSTPSGVTLAMTTTSISTLTTAPDLCDGIRKAQKRKQGQCYGRVLDKLADKTRCYTVYPYQPSSSSSKQEPLGSGSFRMVSLREILNNQNRIQSLSYRDRLQLAVYAASSVLQLYETPWLPSTPTSDNIAFAVWDECPHYGPAFIVAAGSSSNPARGANSARLPSIIRNPTLLALGILLIEIVRGQTTEALRTPEEEAAYRSGPASLLSDYMTARRLLADVYQVSSNYGSAVRRCIDGEFPRQKLDLDDEDFRQEVYSGVVALLEEDYSHA